MTITQYIVLRITLYRVVALTVTLGGIAVLWAFTSWQVALAVLMIVAGEAVERICREALQNVRDCIAEVQEELEEP